MSSPSISRHKAVEIHYTLSNKQGEVLDSSKDKPPLPYIHGVGALVEGLEQALEGKNVGERLNVTVAPENGYGERSDKLIQSVERTLFQFDGDIEIGMRFEAEAENGLELVTVVALDEKTITIDANHPLAGETLCFDVEVMTIRDANEEELAHGHVHNESGCGH